VTRIKICGLRRPEDVELAVELGADAVGFVLEPSSPRCLDAQEAEELARLAAPFCTAVAVYGRARGPFPQMQAFQAVAFEDFPPGSRLLAVRMRPDSSVAEIVEQSLGVGALVLDAYSPTAYGGTGKTVDWERAAEVVRACQVPVVLAGGLTAENVAEAIATVRPYAVDVSSGVESEPGIKDHGKVRAFIQAAREPAFP
jgi:phosphoribosylanthranilate isomerase